MIPERQGSSLISRKEDKHIEANLEKSDLDSSKVSLNLYLSTYSDKHCLNTDVVL